MNVNPTKACRTVMLDIQTIATDQPQPDRTKSAATEVIVSLRMIVDDGVQVTAAVFSGAPERDLLSGFWGAVRSGDVFYGYHVVDLLAFLRERTWACGLLPSLELDLLTVYRHHAVDTAALRSSTSDARYRSAEALASVLGLP